MGVSATRNGTIVLPDKIPEEGLAASLLTVNQQFMAFDNPESIHLLP
jgi:hypothetical protein